MATDPFNITSEARNTLLVVTTLIVAVTFQAAINPPAGVWQDDKYSPANCTADTTDNNCTRIARAGTSVLHHQSKLRYGIFIFVNSLAFSAATCTIYFLLLGSPFRTETLISIYCMNGAYIASVGAVQPQTKKTWAILIGAILAPYIFRVFASIRKRHKLAREQDVSQGPPVFQLAISIENRRPRTIQNQKN
ncbi:hypothetical protein SADUNF_Sadunf16G0192000 [Salix dunnii]|uniref:PGG domain-containing protein n=1 Tax=Salix dunnii TaxID=1413687 RepID=A0A835JCJ7_9ROSI|nr:hypothetical protein SADUNF_Sadunf16G0192000 [Salix dunnii]